VILAADTAVRFLHLLGAAVWVGGVIFLGVAATTARRTVSDRDRIAFFRTFGRRFAVIAGAAIVVLVATGWEMAAERIPDWPDLGDSDYARELRDKLGLVVLVVALTAYHSFVQGPALSRLREQALDRPDDGALRGEIRRRSARAGVVQVLILLVTLAILWMAARLVT
jgi:putative copper export protein